MKIGQFFLLFKWRKKKFSFFIVSKASLQLTFNRLQFTSSPFMSSVFTFGQSSIVACLFYSLSKLSDLKVQLCICPWLLHVKWKTCTQLRCKLRLRNISLSKCFSIFTRNSLCNKFKLNQQTKRRCKMMMIMITIMMMQMQMAKLGRRNKMERRNFQCSCLSNVSFKSSKR